VVWLVGENGLGLRKNALAEILEIEPVAEAEKQALLRASRDARSSHLTLAREISANFEFDLGLLNRVIVEPECRLQLPEATRRKFFSAVSISRSRADPQLSCNRDARVDIGRVGS
jgi:hypothetical protein